MKIRPILNFSHIFFDNSLQFQKLYLPLQPQTRKIGAIAQLVEQRTENPCVPGSIPGGTTFRKRYRNVAQLVAHYVRDVGVGRSSRLIPTQAKISRCFSQRLILF